MRLFVLAILLLPSVAAATPADDDFAARCAAAGVVYCADFDSVVVGGSPSKARINGVPIEADGLGVNRYAIDTSVKASGVGSLRFDIPPPPHAAANVAGEWDPDAPGQNTGGASWKHNQTFYFQYRVRFSKFLLENTWPVNSSWKVGYAWMWPVPCSGAPGIVITNRLMTGIWNGYSACGSWPFIADDPTLTWQLPDATYFHQQDASGGLCKYGQETPGPNCIRMEPNVWYTIYGHISLGNWVSQPTLGTSQIRLYLGSERWSGYRQFIHITDMPMDCRTPPGCTGDTEAYNVFTLDGAYMTGLPETSGLPYPAYLWYDEFIVSNSPIAAPAVPPDNPVWKIQHAGGGSRSGGGVSQ